MCYTIGYIYLLVEKGKSKFLKVINFKPDKVYYAEMETRITLNHVAIGDLIGPL